MRWALLALRCLHRWHYTATVRGHKSVIEYMAWGWTVTDKGFSVVSLGAIAIRERLPRRLATSDSSHAVHESRCER